MIRFSAVPLAAVSAAWWGTLLAVSVALVGVAIILTIGIARGRISMELRWGTSWMPLRERLVPVEAPPEIVLGLLREAARGQVPGTTRRERTAVLEESQDLIVNESLNDSRFGLVRAREAVRFHPDGRVTYRHLAGPLPGTEETFEVRPTDGGSELAYSGRIPVDFWALGRLVARSLILPEYERLVDAHLAALRTTCRVRAARGRRTGPSATG